MARRRFIAGMADKGNNTVMARFDSGVRANVVMGIMAIMTRTLLWLSGRWHQMYG